MEGRYTQGGFYTNGHLSPTRQGVEQLQGPEGD